MIRVYCHKVLPKNIIDNSYFGKRTAIYRDAGIKYVVFPDRFHYNCYYSKKELLRVYDDIVLNRYCDVYFY